MALTGSRSCVLRHYIYQLMWNIRLFQIIDLLRVLRQSAACQRAVRRHGNVILSAEFRSLPLFFPEDHLFILICICLFRLFTVPSQVRTPFSDMGNAGSWTEYRTQDCRPYFLIIILQNYNFHNSLSYYVFWHCSVNGCLHSYTNCIRHYSSVSVRVAVMLPFPSTFFSSSADRSCTLPSLVKFHVLGA